MDALMRLMRQTRHDAMNTSMFDAEAYVAVRTGNKSGKSNNRRRIWVNRCLAPKMPFDLLLCMVLHVFASIN
jgi:hypothetical protein